MRDDIRKPPIDPDVLTRAIALARKIYARHAAGAEYGEILAQLGQMTSHSLEESDAYAAFGSIDPENWVRGLLLMNCACPSDLSDVELLELVDAIFKSDGEEWQIEWWLRCVALNTGCTNVSDLINYPSEVLGKADGRVELTPEEILFEARRHSKQFIMMPPASDGAE